MTWISDSRAGCRNSASARAGSLALAIALTLVTAGCTGGDSATPSATTPNLATPTPDQSTLAPPTEPVGEPTVTRPPAPEPPEQSAEMEGTDALAAFETAEYFIEALNYGLRTGNTRYVSQIAADDCGPCAALIDSIEVISASGGWQEGGLLTYDSEPTIPEDHEALTEIPVQFHIDQTGSRSFGADGRAGESQEARSFVMQVAVSVDTGHWRVTNLLKAEP